MVEEVRLGAFFERKVTECQLGQRLKDHGPDCETQLHLQNSPGSSSAS